MFEAANFEANLKIVEELGAIANAHRCKTSQVALAWVSAQGEDVFPIPGTKRRTWLRENIESLQVALSGAELERIGRVSSLARGERKNPAGMQLVDH